jgi:hypothetical protein
VLVGHTGEGITTASGLRDFLADNPNASAHAAIDCDVILSGAADGLVPDERAAWTAGPTGNSIGLHAEMAAFVAMSRAQWLSETDVDVWVPWIGGTGAWRRVRRPRQMVRNFSVWLLAKSLKWNIPLVKLSAAEVRAGARGVCGHDDISRAFGETNHTDPQPNFPWDVALADARGDAPTQKTTPRVVGDDMLIRNLKTGATATLSGGFVSGVTNTNADATNTAAGKALMLGLEPAEWDDHVRKSRAQESLAAKLDQLNASVQQLVALLSGGAK